MWDIIEGKLSKIKSDFFYRLYLVDQCNILEEMKTNWVVILLLFAKKSCAADKSNFVIYVTIKYFSMLYSEKIITMWCMKRDNLNRSCNLLTFFYNEHENNPWSTALYKCKYTVQIIAELYNFTIYTIFAYNLKK